MKKNKPKIILIIFSILLGIFISTQVKSKVDLYLPVTLQSLKDTKLQINRLNDEIDELNRISKEKEEELEMLDKISKGDDNIMDILALDLMDNRSKSGRSKLTGPGITIKMYDNQDSEIIGFDVNDDVIHDVDILNILNDLKIAGAEAISINDQRIVSTTAVKCLGPVVKINGRSVGNPFYIHAIGDPKVLMASVNAPGTYGDTLRSVYKIGFEPKIEDKVIIPSYSGRFAFKYAKPIGEGDK